MPYYGVKPQFEIGSVYHLYNRGVAKQSIFLGSEDRERFLLTAAYYIEAAPIGKLANLPMEQRFFLDATPATQPLIDVIAYCLMPNHFHLLVRQIRDNGVSTFMRRALNSYTRAFNARHRRVGPVFQGVYQAVGIESNEHALHVSRYIHLNPFVAKLVDVPSYRWSSYDQTLTAQDSRLCQASYLVELAGSGKRYQEFVRDYVSYARDLAAYKDGLIDLYN